ncbi:MAG: hypothetical protein KJ847_00155 [Firmicutes bacterium]|nr:hypothetical protein [Bacillota bacterium]
MFIENIIQIMIPVLALIVLFFAYFKNNNLGKLSAFTMLAAILLVHVLNGFAGLISDVDFLNFLENIFRGVSGLVVYAELVVLVILVFFSKYKSKVALLKWSIVAYVVLVLLLEFHVFN